RGRPASPGRPGTGRRQEGRCAARCRTRASRSGASKATRGRCAGASSWKTPSGTQGAPPTLVRMKTVTTDDGLALVTQTWPAPGEAARGLVVIVHGLGEHCRRYDHVARRLNAVGFDVVGYDHRGHGHSPGPRGGIPADDSLCADLGRVLRA